MKLRSKNLIAVLTMLILAAMFGCINANAYEIRRSVSETDITLSENEFIYTGDMCMPEVTVSDTQTTYKLGMDYKVKYESNTSIGTATVYVTGMGRLMGCSTTSFEIKAPKSSITSLEETDNLTSYKINYSQSENCDSYVVEYSVNADMSASERVRVTDSTVTSTTLTGLKTNTTYFVRVKSNYKSNGNNVSAGYSDTESFTTPDLDISQGWETDTTNYFAYESRGGITQNPSYQYTWAADNYVDTTSGIVRNKYGDYMCAMGTVFGYCGDRFRITMSSGNQFTVQIGDSKGDCEYHTFGNGSVCYIEFIIDNATASSVAPSVMVAGNYNALSQFSGSVRKIEKIS